jgi:hypothetical protein
VCDTQCIKLSYKITQQDTDGDKGQEQEEKSVYPAQDMVSQKLSMCQ